MATTFAYSVRDRGGRLVHGTLEADSQMLVVQKLRTMGFAPVRITETNTGLKKEIRLGKGKVTLKDLAVFSRQFATMINSGLPLLRALNILTDQTEARRLAEVLREVRNEVERGGSLSTSLGTHPDVFPSLMVNMVKAGEVGGFLDSTLLQLADTFEKEVKLRGKIKSAMTYPLVVFVMAMIAVVVMLIFVVPTFASIFNGLGGQLPAPTRLLVAMSHGLKVAILPLIVVLVAVVVVWKKVKRQERVRRVVDPLKLKLPVFGPLFQKVALSRFCRNFGTMLHSGVPILQALDIVGDTSGNIVIADAVRDVQHAVRSGESITGPLAKHEIFPAMVQQMMAVGEETGALDMMMGKISDFYDAEVEATTESLTALLEPLMIAFLGAIIGSMVVAMYLPIFKVFNLINAS